MDDKDCCLLTFDSGAAVAERNQNMSATSPKPKTSNSIPDVNNNSKDSKDRHRDSDAYLTEVMAPELGSHGFMFRYEKEKALSLTSKHSKRTDGETNLIEFEMLRILGRGSFGKVLLVHCPDIHAVRKEWVGQLMAIKIMEKQRVQRQEIHTNNERRILAACRHQFILEYYFSFQDSVNLYLATEFVCGGELFSYLQSKPKGFSVDSVRFYCSQVILAFEYLHRFNCVYRDLKPENVLVAQNGYLKLADLGFAKIIKDGFTMTFCGTLEYIAPEVFKSATTSQGYGKPADWWAIGVLIYELHVGEAPWIPVSGNALDFLKNIEKTPLRFPKRVGTDCRDLVSHLCERDTTKRFGCLHNGVRDVKSHAFFDDLSWEGLMKQQIKAPYVPSQKSVAVLMRNNESDAKMREEAKKLAEKGHKHYAYPEKFTDW